MNRLKAISGEDMDKIPRSSQGDFDQPHIPDTIYSAMFSDLLVMDG